MINMIGRNSRCHIDYRAISKQSIPCRDVILEKLSNKTTENILDCNNTSKQQEAKKSI